MVALVLLSSLLVYAQSSGRVMVTGIVVDSVTGEPLPGVLVTSRIAQGNSPTALTNRRGEFTIAAAPGRSTFVFGKDNFGVRAVNFAIPVATRFQVPVTRLARHGVLTGRVFDSRNNPVASAEVTPYVVDDEKGGPGFGRYPGTRTDDRGEFRLSGLTPNSYVLIFASPAGTAFYPGVSEFSKADPIRLTSGKEIRLKDVVLSMPPKKGTIRVNVVNGPNEDAKDVTYTFANTTPEMEPAGLDGTLSFTFLRSRSPNLAVHLQPEESRPLTHEVSGIGGYRATATWKDPGGKIVSSSMETVFVGDDVVMNLELQTPQGRLSCRMLLDAEDGSSIPVSGVDVQLHPRIGRHIAGCTSQADGTSEVEALHTGRYDLWSFMNAPADSYPASAVQNGRDVLTEGIDVSAHSSLIEIHFRRGAGIIRGVLRDREGRAVHGALVVAIPDIRAPYEGGGRPLYSNQTDQDGGFEIRALRPATYKLAGWAAFDYALADKDFFKGVGEKGIAVTVDERGVVVQNLRALEEQ